MEQGQRSASLYLHFTARFSPSAPAPLCFGLETVCTGNLGGLFHSCRPLSVLHTTLGFCSNAVKSRFTV